MSQHIIVNDYNPIWTEKYKEEVSLIQPILAENCVALYHIGSTSVPGLAAKPIIDIMAVVRSLAEVDSVAEKFSDVGYEYLGEFGIVGRRYLRRAAMSERTKSISFRRMIGITLVGILHFVTICAHTKKSGTNMQK